MKIELHLLQNFPPSNLNRDDMNEPKDCEFGGYRRARISSQCIKRSIRRSPEFIHELTDRVARRTKRIVLLLTDLLIEHGKEKELAEQLSSELAQRLVGTVSAKKSGETMYLETDVLYYVGNDELRWLVGQLNSDSVWNEFSAMYAPVMEARKATKEGDGSDKKALETLKKRMDDVAAPLSKLLDPIVKAYKKSFGQSVGAVDIALFGRMLAKDPALNRDAACQVAHALSTNEVKMEFDYYTAVDDLKEEESELGAGMIGFTGFNSSCYYRYAVIDVDQLHRNLKDGNQELVKAGVGGFLRAAVTAIPTGKQNSFAAHPPTVLAFGVVRENSMPVSLVNAFEKPVRPSDQGSLVQDSVRQLAQHWNAITKMFPKHGATGIVAVMDEMGSVSEMTKGGAVTQVASVDEVVDGVLQLLDDKWKPESEGRL